MIFMLRSPPMPSQTLDEPVVVTIGASEVDELSVEAVARQLFGVVEQSGPRRVVLDFGKVRYATSTLLGRLIALRSRVLASGGQLALCNVSPLLYEMLEVTRLTQVFEVHRGGEAA
jgi:anti-sigma B factor antagonist